MGVMPLPVDAGSLATQQMAIRFATNVQRLSALDDVWTGYLGSKPEAARIEGDRPELTQLVSEMTVLIDDIAKDSHGLRNAIRELPADFEKQALAHIRCQPPLGESIMEMLPEGLILSETTAACAIIEEEAASEAAELRAKLDRLLREGYTPGDLGPRFKCAILLAGAGVAIVGVGLTLVAPVPGAAVTITGIVISNVVAANGWSCRRAGDLATAVA